MFAPFPGSIRQLRSIVWTFFKAATLFSFTFDKSSAFQFLKQVCKYQVSRQKRTEVLLVHKPLSQSGALPRATALRNIRFAFGFMRITFKCRYQLHISITDDNVLLLLLLFLLLLLLLLLLMLLLLLLMLMLMLLLLLLLRLARFLNKKRRSQRDP